jgi:antirestriction protein ArdC
VASPNRAFRNSKWQAQEHLTHWLRILRVDATALVAAAAKASAAAEFILKGEQQVSAEAA